MKLKIYTFLTLLFISILYLQAQDYEVSFTGIGSISTVASVKVENLTQGTSLTMNGSDVLHLLGSVTGIETVNGNMTNDIVFYPNPMNDYTKMQFNLSENGKTVISLYDISGKKIIQKQDFLTIGQHTYEIRGIKEGIYFVRIKSGSLSLNGRLINSGSNSSNVKIQYASSTEVENLIESQGKQSDSKNINAEVVMQYNSGDRLRFTGISDIYRTIIMDVPTESKTITFIFFACTDGNYYNYPLIQIGGQIWMAENLKTTKLNDNSAINYALNVLSPAYCWYNNDESTYKNSYGGLYNYYAVSTGKLCPVGWHIPTQDEWTILTDFSGDTSVAGGKLKETGTKHWKSPNTGATNEFGFTALPGGAYNTKFFDVNQNTYWWSGTSGLFYQLYYNSSSIGKNTTSWTDMFSVRCVKDGSILLPSVTTNEVSGIYYDKAMCGGNVI
ncbi:MAG: T9SS type A sorting domain-containing protein, partial [Bacteroidales bacterium]|nr:T9SS type A sorting domain-containing protein [Bacteroidales bacterium]